jgi:hypothetical protein
MSLISRRPAIERRIGTVLVTCRKGATAALVAAMTTSGPSAINSIAGRRRHRRGRAAALPRRARNPGAASAALSREASDASSIKRQPAHAERRVPLDWVEGVDRLQYHRPMSGVPHHRWRQFIDDCTKFLNSKWAERAAQLGWEAWVLFGCCRDRPLVHRDGIGLLWEVNGGRVVEIHRDWAGIELAGNGSHKAQGQPRG